MTFLFAATVVACATTCVDICKMFVVTFVLAFTTQRTTGALNHVKLATIRVMTVAMNGLLVFYFRLSSLN